MKEFLIYIAQSSICLAIFWLVYFFLLRKQTCFRFNRYFLLIGMGLSLIFPLIQFSYDVAVVLPSMDFSLNESEGFQNVNEMSSAVSVWGVLGVIYVLGLFITLARNIKVYLHLRKLKKEGRQNLEGGYVVVYHNQVSTPFSFMNRIYLNQKKLQEKEKSIIIKHEISHIKQKHWIDLLWVECILLLQWFNPIMWFYMHSMKENHEYLADEAVLKGGESAVLYRAVLINQRFQGPVFSFVNSFSYSNYQNRLFMMKKTKTSSWKKMAVLALFPLLGFFFSISAKPNYIYVDGESQEATSDSTKIVVKGIETKGEIASVKLSSLDGLSGDSLLLIIDGKEVSQTELKTLNNEDVDNISVLKGQSGIEVYGDKGKNGVIIINKTKKDWSDVDALLIIDGEEKTKKDMDALSSDQIESISVLKGQSGIEAYGDKGKNGVIIITLKKEDSSQ